MQSRRITWFPWARTAPPCRVGLLVSEVDELKWCAGDEIRGVAVEDEDTLNADG